MVRIHLTVPSSYFILATRVIKPELNIIGAGPVGLACGITALKRGYKVKIITEDPETAHIAGLAAGGMLAPAYECLCLSDDEFSQFAFASRRLWLEFEKEFDLHVHPIGLSLAQTQDEYNFLEKQRLAAKEFDYDFEFIDVPENIRAKSALRLTSDGLINPIKTYEKLLSAFQSLGGQIVYDKVLDLEEDKIICDWQTFKSEATIIAAGYHSKKFAAFLLELNHLIPTRGQVIKIDAEAPVDGSVRYKTTYIMKRDGKTVVGATAQTGSEDWEPHQKDIDALYQGACELCPELIGKDILNTRVGLRPNTDDEKPILGQSSQKGIFLAAGAYRNGWLLSPQIGKYVIDSIEGIEGSYSYKRFEK